MAERRDVRLLTVQTVTASGNSGAVDCGYADAVVVTIDAPTAPTGTTPSITFSLDYIDPNTGVVYPLTPASGAFAAITAALATPQRVVFDPIYDGHVALSWVVSGATPSFTNVSATLTLTGRGGNGKV